MLMCLSIGIPKTINFPSKKEHILMCLSIGVPKTINFPSKWKINVFRCSNTEVYDKVNFGIIHKKC